MSKVKKRMRIAATIMAVSLSATMITTNMIPVAEVPVQAVEDENTYSKVADSKIEGFYYEKNGYGNVQCTIDKTLEYSSYDEMISKLSEITKKIIQENAYANYSFDFSIRISSDQKDTRLETQKADKDLEKEIYKETGDTKGGHTMAAMGGGLTHLKVTYSEADKAYIGKVYGSAGYGSKTDRYNQTIQKLDEVIKSLDLDGKSDYDKFKAITYWIVSNVKYDNYYAVKDNSSMTPGTKYPHDMTGAVLDGYAVCDGYAGTFYYMANAVGLNALFDGGITKSNRVRHAWNLVQIDGTYYYTDPTNAYFKEDGEPGKELLPGQKYLFILYTPDDTTIEDTYSNISKDDYLKEHSVCKGNHDLWESGHNGATCENSATTQYSCKNKGCLYKKYVETSKALEHEWGNATIIQQQSCEKAEITQYTCTRCKRKKQDVTKESLGGHTWNNGEVTTKPTCTEEGVKTYTCTRCGETKTESIAKIAHVDEEHVVIPATCTSQGVSYKVCKNCGRTTQKRPTAKKAHTPELRKQKEATCKSEGYTGDTYCSVCGKLLESGQKIAKKEHTPGEWEITQPTCKKYGLKRRDCTVCGESLDLEVLEKLDHAWDRGVITKEATETEEGVKTYTCKTCGETKTESIPVISHHWDQGTVSKEATCTEDGEKTYHCTDADCNKTWVETIPATGHQHTEVRDKKEVTCEEDGYTGDTYCKDCGQLISKGTVIKTTGHSWDDGKVSEEATCKKAGIKTYTCKNCGETKTVAIPKKEHSFDEGKIQKKATCTEDGLKIYTCTACGETKEEVLKATGHQHTEVRDEKKATCTEEGYTGDTYCTDCGELIQKGSATEKTDHNWKVVSEEKATCEKDGSKTLVCEDCEETKTETLPATGHKYSSWKTVKAQSIYSGAVQERICSACGKKETRIIGDKLKPVLKVNVPKLQLKRGQKTQKFTLTDMAKGDSVKSWVSSNKKIVTVSGKPNGTCIIKAGKKTGSAKITITMRSNLKKTIGVKVQKKAVACTSIKNVPKKLTLNKKKSYQLKPVIEPITCTQKIKYKTSNKKIAKVNSKGKITAVKKGTAKITISVGKKKTVCKITIK